MTVSPKDPQSREFFTFDYTQDERLDGDSIVSATISMAVESGRDSNASAMLSGPVIISGATVSQLVIGGLVNNVYTIKCLATTTNGQVLDACGSIAINPC